MLQKLLKIKFILNKMRIRLYQDKALRGFFGKFFEMEFKMA